MANFSLKIDLLKLDGATLQQGASGKLAVIIPVEEADLFVGRENRAVYLDLSMWESRNNQYGDTHSIKKSYSQARRQMLGPDAVKAKPFLGNAKPIPDRNATPANQPFVQQPPMGYTPAPSPNKDVVF